MLLGNNEKVALLQAIYVSRYTYYVSSIDLWEQFLTGKPVICKRNHSLILRLITTLPSDMEYVKILKASLFTYAGFLAGQGLTVRRVEWMWANKVLNLLEKFK